MAKRFTDTDKWEKRFLRGLSAAHKLLWLYVCDRCDHAGIWHVTLDMASLLLGFKYKLPEVLQAFGGKVVPFDDGEKWFIPSFIDFQYGTLKEAENGKTNNAHKSVIDRLRKYGFWDSETGSLSLPDSSNEPLTSPSRGALDKDKEKDQDKDQDKEKEKDPKSELKTQAVEVLSFLNEKAEKNFRPVPANLEFIMARLKTGVTVQDCKSIIAMKRRQWINDPERKVYLRPETLFNATKFESYLGELAKEAP